MKKNTKEMGTKMKFFAIKKIVKNRYGTKCEVSTSSVIPVIVDGRQTKIILQPKAAVEYYILDYSTSEPAEILVSDYKLEIPRRPTLLAKFGCETPEQYIERLTALPDTSELVENFTGIRLDEYSEYTA